MKRGLLTGVLLACMLPLAAAAEPTDSLPPVKASLLILQRNRTDPLAYFGHVALRLQAPTVGLDFCFTTESAPDASFHQLLSAPNTVAMVAVPDSTFRAGYLAEGRRIEEYPLNLTQREIRRLWQLLDRQVEAGPSADFDLAHHGCAQRIADLVAAATEGDIRYQPAPSGSATSRFAIAKRQCARHSPHRLALAYLFGTTDMSRPTPDSERIFMPYDLRGLWQTATIAATDSTPQRPLLVTTTPTVTLPRLPLTEPAPLRLDLVLFALLAIVTLVTLLQLRSPAAPTVRLAARITDALLLTAYTLLALFLTYLWLFARLPAVAGFNWNLPAYNLLPPIILAIDSHRHFATQTRLRLYRFYALVLVAMLLLMTLRPNMFVEEQYLVLVIFLVRCLGKAIHGKTSK